MIENITSQFNGRIMQDIKELVALCKRRGFIFPASDLYGGINGFWDFSPLGVELKNNLRDLWWKSMVTCPPVGPDGTPLSILGIDSAIIQNPRVWEASGHVGGFSDPMVDCKETKSRYRLDHIDVMIPNDSADPAFCVMEGADNETIAKRLKKLSRNADISNYTKMPLTSVPVEQYVGIIAPDASKPGTLTEPREFNLMFKTEVGAVSTGDNIAYLRPETAQGIFLNYKNIVDSSRVRIPFGIAQVGKAFRNEVTPRNFIFRSREFEQMEMEWFCHPSEAKKWFDFWTDQRTRWWKDLGIDASELQLRQHDRDELAHYAKEGVGTVDIEYAFPFSGSGFGELEGIAHRGNFDLSQHQTHSKVKLEYFDDESRERYLPHVIEPAAGLTRGVLALLCSAYTVDEKRPSGMYMKFSPKVAPIKAAILPLTAKDGLPELAQDIYMDLRQSHRVELDVKQNIGKRYARQDEIGTPFCFTEDHDSLKDQSVTVRDRDSMSQERIPIASIKSYLALKM